ncbi:MAG TPA: polysaccharide biosynthesis C-terminal domain-containing protein [Kofleriaceae bacterium]|nr:polysaccharide biosynthesis C-terminal domain-containing protein [Kofleriaceae bacterium]
MGLGLNFMIAGWWGAAALGVFNLVTIAYFVMAVVGAWGMQYSVLRAIAERPDDRTHVAAVVVGAIVPNVAIAAASAVAFATLRGPIGKLLGSDDVATGMLWSAPGLFCFAINKVLFGVVNGLRRMRAFAVYTTARYVLIAAGIFAAHVRHVDAAHLAATWSFVEGVLVLVLAVELAATVSIARARGWRRWMRVHLAYGTRSLPASIAYEINTKLDVWMLGAAGVAKAAVGIYSVAAAINEGATQLSVVVQNNLNPLLATELAAGRVDAARELVRNTRRWFVPAFVAACVVGALVFPSLIPKLVGDPAFAAGARPFAVMMAGLALASPYLPFGQLLLMANRPGWHTALMTLVVGANLVVNLFAIPSLGTVGAALATAAAVVTGAIALRVLGRRVVRVQL